MVSSPSNPCRLSSNTIILYHQVLCFIFVSGRSTKEKVSQQSGNYSINSIRAGHSHGVPEPRRARATACKSHGVPEPRRARATECQSHGVQESRRARATACQSHGVPEPRHARVTACHTSAYKRATANVTAGLD